MDSNAYYDNAECCSPIRYGANIIMDMISMVLFNGDFSKVININHVKVGLPIKQDNNIIRRIYYKDKYITSTKDTPVWYRYDDDMYKAIGWYYDDSNRTDGLNPITETFVKPLYDKWQDWLTTYKETWNTSYTNITSFIDDLMEYGIIPTKGVKYTEITKYDRTYTISIMFDKTMYKMRSNQTLVIEIDSIYMGVRYYEEQRWVSVFTYGFESFFRTMQLLYKLSH